MITNLNEVEINCPRNSRASPTLSFFYLRSPQRLSMFSSQYRNRSLLNYLFLPPSHRCLLILSSCWSVLHPSTSLTRFVKLLVHLPSISFTSVHSLHVAQLTTSTTPHHPHLLPIFHPPSHSWTSIGCIHQGASCWGCALVRCKAAK